MITRHENEKNALGLMEIIHQGRPNGNYKSPIPTANKFLSRGRKSNRRFKILAAAKNWISGKPHFCGGCEI